MPMFLPLYSLTKKKNTGATKWKIKKKPKEKSGMKLFS